MTRLVYRFNAHLPLLRQSLDELAAKAREATLEQKRGIAAFYLQQADELSVLYVSPLLYLSRFFSFLLPFFSVLNSVGRGSECVLFASDAPSSTYDFVDLSLVRVACAEAKRVLVDKARACAHTVLATLHEELQADILRLNADATQVQGRLPWLFLLLALLPHWLGGR